MLKTRGDTKLRYAPIVEWVNEVLAEFGDLSLTLRQVYYQLVARQYIPNTPQAYKTLSRMLVRARERGDVDYRRIEDRVRSVNGGEGVHLQVPDPAELVETRIRWLREAADDYHVPTWYGQPHYVEVWVEKDALSKVVASAANPLGVSVAVARGYSSFTFVMDAVERFQAAVAVDRTPLILYFGDFDPSGEDMVRDLTDRIERYGDVAVDVRKVALTPEQIRKYQLPPAPTKKTDARAAVFIERHGDACVELDALDPYVLRDLVSSAIHQLYDPVIASKAEEVEEEGRKKVMEILEEMGVQA